VKCEHAASTKKREKVYTRSHIQEAGAKSDPIKSGLFGPTRSSRRASWYFLSEGWWGMQEFGGNGNRRPMLDTRT
jgi:hypothetical protein